MTADELSELDEASQGTEVPQSDSIRHPHSDFWVGLLVIGGTCYGLLAVAKLIFF